MGVKRPKVTIVGAGNVGHSTAHWLASKELADIILVDIIEGMPQGKALDLQQAGPIEGLDVRIVGSNSYEETADSQIVVIVAGVPRKPGMTREQLLETNASIVRSVTEQVVKYSPDCFLLVVTNPLDAMTYLAYKVSGFPAHRVMGQSGALDSTRFRTFIAMEAGVSVEDVQALVIGAHTDKDMVPLPRFSTIGGVPLDVFLPPERIQAIVARTRRGGAEIVELLKTGSAFFAPGAAVTQMVEAILKDKRRLIPTCAYLNGEYGERDVCIGVPAIIGGNGIERIIELPLNEEELQAFRNSVGVIREQINQLKAFL
jgi:malate dehydrogenase